MAKPERQPSEGVALFIDGILVKRVQRVNATVDVTTEDTLELANSGVVQKVRESDSVTVQIDTNAIGSTDLLALLTDTLLDYTIATVHDDPRNAYGGSGSISVDHKWFVKVASSNASYRAITETDLLNNYCNVMVAANQNTTAAARSMFAPKCAVTNLSYNFDINGNATENYTVVSDKKVWFLNTYKATKGYKPVFNQVNRFAHSGTNTTSLAFVGLQSCLPWGATPVAVLLNDTLIFRDQTTGSASRWEFSGVMKDITENQSSAFSIYHRTGSGDSVPLSTPFVSTASNTTDRTFVLWYGGIDDDWDVSTTHEGYSLVSTTGALGGLRKGQIKAFLFNWSTDSLSANSEGATTAGRALRLQTVGIDVSPGEERLYELGKQNHFAIAKQSPVPVTVNVTAYDTDLQYYAYAAATAIAAPDDTTTNSPNYINSESFTGNNQLVIEIYKDTDQTILLETIYVQDMTVESESFESNVGAQGTQEFTFTADNIRVVGNSDGTGSFNTTGGWYDGTNQYTF